MHIFRWDLDRTYLDTDIHSVRGLIRTALEGASQKRALPGSAALIRGLLRTDPSAKVFVLSGSPTQMREVLVRKLALDGVRFERLVLKDNLSNIRRGRLSAVRGQVGFKLPQLLSDRVGLGPSVRESLFGDDSESDALIYATYAAAVKGVIGAQEVARVLEARGAYKDDIERALWALGKVGQADAVEDIFIRLDRWTPPDQFRALGSLVIPVFSWFQAALLLWHRGRLEISGVIEVARSCAQVRRLDALAMAGLVQDVARRGLVPAEKLSELFRSDAGFEDLSGEADRVLAVLGPAVAPLAARPADLLGYLSRRS
jgi:hypothetical protein